MTKRLVLFLALALPGLAMADDVAIHRANNEAGVEAVYNRMVYHELNEGMVPGAGAYADSEQGNGPGVRLNYSVQTNLEDVENFYFAAQFQHAPIHTDYTGYDQYVDPATQAISYQPAVSTTNDTVDDFSVRMGEGLEIGPATQLTPYVTLAHRRWERDLQGPGGYTEVYNHSMLGIGARLQQALGDNLVIGADAEAGRTFGATMDTAGAWNSLNLANRPIYGVGLDVDYNLRNGMHLTGGVDATRFSYGASQPVGTDSGYAIMEPDSRTVTGQVHAGLAWDIW